MRGDTPGGKSLRAAMDAYERVVDLPDARRRPELDALEPGVRALVVSMLAADPDLAPPDLSDVWMGLRGAAKAGRPLPPVAPAPAFIAEFEVVGELGRGAHGVVYEAIQPAPRRRVAVKLLAPLPAEARRRLFDEAERLAELEHPAFPYVVRAGEDGGRAFIAMQLVSGVRLDVWASSVPPRARLDAVLALCEAMAFAHKQGIVHRDLKPSNLLMGHDGRLRVIDLGLACGPDDGLVTTAGTLAYMAPEGTFSVAADVYAMGVIAWELLAGQPPFAVAGLGMRRAAAVKRGPLPTLPPIPGVPSAVARALARALDPDPARRIADAPSLDLALRAALRPSPVVVAGAIGLGVGALLLAFSLWPSTSVSLGALEQQAVARAAAGEEAVTWMRSSLGDLRRSDATAEAWLRLAGSLQDPGERAIALVEAWDAAVTPALLAPIALEIGERLRLERAWDGLAAVVEVAREDGAPQVELERSLAISRRTWRGDDALLGSLAGAVQLPVVGDAVAVDGGELIVAGERLTVLGVADLAVHAEAPAPGLVADGGIWTARAGGSRLVFTNGGEASGLWRWDKALTPVVSWSHDRILDVSSAGGEILVGFGEGSRTLQRLDPLTGALTPHRLSGLGSDVQDILPIEGGVVAAFGPWEAYFVTGAQPDGAVFGHYRVSGSTRLASLGDEIALVTGPRYAPPGSRGSDVPPGLHVLRRTEAGLEQTAFLAPALADLPEAPWAVRSLATADLNGDGQLELVAGLLLGDRVATWVLERAGDGWRGELIDQTLPLAVVQADEDPAQEVVLRLVDQGNALWIAGRGADPMPRVEGDAPPALASRRARLLYAVQAWPQLASELSEAGDATGLAWVVGRLRASRMDREILRALEVATDETLRAAGLAGELVRLLASEGHGGAAMVRAQELGVATGGLVRPAKVPPSAWRVPLPARVRMKPDHLELRGSGGDNLLAALDIRAGAAVEVRLELDLTRVEPGTLADVVLVRGGVDVVSARLAGWGGRGAVQRELSCAGPGVPSQAPWSTTHSTDHAQRVVLELASGPEGSRCQLGLAGGPARLVEGARAPADGDWTLELRTTRNPVAEVVELVAEVREVEVVGGEAIVPTGGPGADWAAGRLRAAWAALPPGLEREMLEVELGQETVAEAVLRSPDEELARMLRRDARVWLPWMQRVLPNARLQTVFQAAWVGVTLDEADPNIALAMLSQVPEQVPWRTDDACWFGWVRGRWLFRAGHLDRAALTLERMLRECPGVPWSLDAGVELVRALHGSGRDDDARAACARTATTAQQQVFYEVDITRFGLEALCPRPGVGPGR